VQRTQRQKKRPNVQGRDARRKEVLFVPASWEIHTANGFSRNNLCALGLLFVPPLPFFPGGSKGQEEFISLESFDFFVFTQENLGGLCVLCG